MPGAELNQTGYEKKPAGVRTYKQNPRGPMGKSGPELDNTFRKPFPNMGETKTGREGK